MIETINIDDLDFMEQENHYMIKRSKKYYKLGKVEGEILKLLGSNEPQKKIQDNYNLEEKDLIAFVESLKNVGILGKEKKERKNILFYKIPLINPDRWFDHIVSKVLLQGEFIRYIFFSFVFLISIGLILTVKNFDTITSVQKITKFSIQSYVGFYIASVIAVFIHEIGHGLVCKYYGGKVEEIGFLLLLFSPALYCDVSGIRQFKNKKAKIHTLLAGVFVQLSIFSLSIICFTISKNAWFAYFAMWNLVMTITNVMPITKLDGYWILSTLLDVPNLYNKSLKLALGLNTDEVLFYESEKKLKNVIKIYGYINLITSAILLLSVLMNLLNRVIPSDFDNATKIILIISIPVGLFLLKKKMNNKVGENK